jgi:tetratricopeptide (TPR) repeat protein
VTKTLYTLLVVLLSSAFLQLPPSEPDLNKVAKIIGKYKKDIALAEGELVFAKNNVDLAIEMAQFARQPKTWYLRGWVYRILSGQAGGISEEEAIQVSTFSFERAIALGSETDIYSTRSSTELEALWGGFLNEGVSSYQSGDLENAVKFFQYCSVIKPKDTTGYLYAASAAMENQRFHVALRNYNQLAKISPSEDIYSSIISIQKDALNDYGAAMTTINEARQTLGGDIVKIRMMEVDLLIVTQKYDEAIILLNELMLKSPHDAMLPLKKGLLFDDLASSAKQGALPDPEIIRTYSNLAEQAYQQTLQRDPDNFTALFNYAVIYHSRANAYFEQLQKMTPATDDAKKKEIEATASENLTIALQLMEKAYQLEPEDQDVLYALEAMYSRLGRDVKLGQIRDKMRVLGFH